MRRPAILGDGRRTATIRIERGDLGDDEAMIEGWVVRSTERSLARRSARRASRRRARRGVGAACLAVLVAALGIHPVKVSEAGSPHPAVAATAGDGGTPRMGSGAVDATRRPRGGRKVPSAAGIRRASEFAAARAGTVSFATVNSEGKLRGRALDRRHPSASLVKAMLLAAEVRRLAHDPIDSETDSLLRAMITVSDNDAADAIYARIGDAGLNAVAARAGMTRYTVAGHWGNSQIAAGDMALFFADLDAAFPRRHREYAKGLLGSIVPDQSWGIPDAAGERWAVRFKGGWLPDHALVNQAAELRERDGGRELSIAVLTDLQPSHEYGVETVRGIAQRLLDR